MPQFDLLPTLSEQFTQLGAPEHVGHCFAVTRYCLHKEHGGSVESLLQALPTPGYEHRIVQDPVTGNVLVERASDDGAYCAEWDQYKRLR